MECLGGDVNRMVCGMVGCVEGQLGDGEDGVNLVLGDCVWCVLLPKLVANATNSSKTTPPVSHG